MEWINIKDRLPAEGEPVIVWESTGMTIAHLLGFSSDSRKPEWIESFGNCSFQSVTHWMELPKPPTSEGFSSDEES